MNAALFRGFRSSVLLGWGLTLALAAAAAAAVSLWYVLPSQQAPAPAPHPPPAPVICIDPGHPTDFNSGRAVRNGLREIDVNWEIALKLEAVLRDDYGLRVVKTRERREQLMNNPERAEVSNRAGAALFLRLHCDAGPGHGFTVYYPDRQGTDVGVTGPSQEVIDGSRRAAHHIHAGMASALEGILRDRGVKGETSTLVGSRQGALTGSIFSKAPVVTVEMLFLTDPSDAMFIAGEAGKNTMTRALADGVMNYLRSLEKEASVSD